MAAPKTPLMVAPAGATDRVGKAIPSSVLLDKLAKLNPRLFCPDANDAGHIEGWHGVTSLWMGTPGSGRPICGIKLGVIPEWTMVDERGVMVSKGWRAIFDKVIKAGGARREDLERAFGVSLGDAGVDARLCRACVREGRQMASNGGAANMCDLHDGAYASAERARTEGPELAEKAGWKKEKEIVH